MFCLSAFPFSGNHLRQRKKGGATVDTAGPRHGRLHQADLRLRPSSKMPKPAKLIRLSAAGSGMAVPDTVKTPVLSTKLKSKPLLVPVHVPMGSVREVPFTVTALKSPAGLPVNEKSWNKPACGVASAIANVPA